MISNQNIIQIIKYMLTKNNKMKRWLWQSDKIGAAMELGNVCDFSIFQESLKQNNGLYWKAE